MCACSPKLDIPADAQITCDSSVDCPDAYACLVSIHTCVRKDGDITLPVITSSECHADAGNP